MEIPKEVQMEFEQSLEADIGAWVAGIKAHINKLEPAEASKANDDLSKEFN